MRWGTLVTVTLLCGSATAAAAKDLCFLDDLGLPPLVATDFAVPRAGHCTNFRGYFQDGAFLASGLACVSTQIENINFQVNIEPPIVDEKVTYSFFVNRVTLTGEGSLFCSPVECGAVFGVPYGSPKFSIRQVACPPKGAPVP